MYLRDRAIVLRQMPVREHDLRVILFGRTHGKIEALARGAKKAQAKQSGHVEPFSEIEVMVAKGKNGDKLAVARLVRPYPSLRTHLGMLAIAGPFFALVDQLTRPGLSDALIYALLQEVLDLADQTQAEPSPERSQLLFAGASFKLLDLLGYAMHLERCVSCDAPLVQTSAYAPRSGGCICAACEKTRKIEIRPLVFVPDQGLRLLRFLRYRPLKEICNITAAAALFGSISHLVEEALKQTPITQEPHGFQTIRALLESPSVRR